MKTSKQQALLSENIKTEWEKEKEKEKEKPYVQKNRRIEMFYNMAPVAVAGPEMPCGPFKN